MQTNEINVVVLAEKIKQLDTKQVLAIVSEMNAVFKKSKKKALTSGTQTFNQFCETIANNLANRPIVKPLIEKHKLV